MATAAADLEPQRSQFTEDALAVWGEIRRLGLEYHVAELDALGLTVIPPETLNAGDLVPELIETTRALVERRRGETLDWEGGGSLGDRYDGIGQTCDGLAIEAPVYQRMVLNPVALALADYTVGRSCFLATCLALLKSSSTRDLALHTDYLGYPAPYPAQIQLLNVTWPLVDYTVESGALCYVPGSHRQYRPPLRNEGVADRVPVEAPAGSLIVWNGAVWHGAFARQRPGYRLNIVTSYSRSYVITQERYVLKAPPAVVARNPPRFATLMGLDNPQFGEHGFDPDKGANLAGATWWD